MSGTALVGLQVAQIKGDGSSNALPGTQLPTYAPLTNTPQRSVGASTSSSSAASSSTGAASARVVAADFVPMTTKAVAADFIPLDLATEHAQRGANDPPPPPGKGYMDSEMRAGIGQSRLRAKAQTAAVESARVLGQSSKRLGDVLNERVPGAAHAGASLRAGVGDLSRDVTKVSDAVKGGMSDVSYHMGLTAAVSLHRVTLAVDNVSSSWSKSVSDALDHRESEHAVSDAAVPGQAPLPRLLRLNQIVGRVQSVVNKMMLPGRNGSGDGLMDGLDAYMNQRECLRVMESARHGAGDLRLAPFLAAVKGSSIATLSSLGSWTYVASKEIKLCVLLVEQSKQRSAAARSARAVTQLSPATQSLPSLVIAAHSSPSPPLVLCSQ